MARAPSERAGARARDAALSGQHRAVGRRRVAVGCAGRARRARRRLRLGEDDDAAHRRGLRDAGLRPRDADRRVGRDARHHARAAAAARLRDGVPALRALPAHDRRARTSRSGSRRAESGRRERLERAREALAGVGLDGKASATGAGAFRRRAAARRARARAGDLAARPAARRAAVQPRSRRCARRCATSCAPRCAAPA